MVSRIMLSLRKLADPRRGNWSLADPAGNGPSMKSMKFVRHPRTANEGREDTRLDTYTSRGVLDGDPADVGMP